MMMASGLSMLLCIAFTSLWPGVAAQNGSDILKYVDPLIGTANGGHVFA